MKLFSLHIDLKLNLLVSRKCFRHCNWASCNLYSDHWKATEAAILDVWLYVFLQTTFTFFMEIVLFHLQMIRSSFGNSILPGFQCFPGMLGGSLEHPRCTGSRFITRHRIYLFSTNRVTFWIEHQILTLLEYFDQKTNGSEAEKLDPSRKKKRELVFPV